MWLLYVYGILLLDRQQLKLIYPVTSELFFTVQVNLVSNFFTTQKSSPQICTKLGMASSNCKFLAERIKTLEARISVLEGQLEMARHPENHTLESAGILHEIYQGMRNLNME
ncbi:hypothetical protein Tco_1145485 [Tanacetum coccineum]